MFYKEDKVNMLIGLLKEYHVENVVLCPGSRNAIIANNILEDGSFNCFPVTDERSAGFFALGLSIGMNPSAIVVTSGSALLNVAPAIVEAYYQRVPVIVISADRPQEDIGQNVGQTMRQYGALDNYVACSMNLTDAMGDNTYYHNRLICEALAKSGEYKRPVHINVPLPSPAECEQADDMPAIPYNKIYVPEVSCDIEDIRDVVDEMSSARRPMIVLGQEIATQGLSAELEMLKQSVVVLSEPLSDIYARPYAGFIDSIPDSMLPDFIVYIGGTTVCRSIYSRLASITNLTVWRVDQAGEFTSPFRRLDGVLRCSAFDFVRIASDRLKMDKPVVNSSYYHEWHEAFGKENQRLMSIDDNMLTAAATVKYFEEQLEDIDYDYYVHYGNSTAVRLACQYAWGHGVYCNRGINGIEGSLSTAAGHSVIKENDMVFCVLGDLSFFYDQNALWNNNLSGNLRIIILNDHHGGIFDNVKGLEKCAGRDRFIAGRHTADARGICTQNDIGYLSAKTVAEMHLGIVTLLTAETERPMVMEVMVGS